MAAEEAVGEDIGVRRAEVIGDVALVGDGALVRDAALVGDAVIGDAVIGEQDVDFLTIVYNVKQ